jgi:hypothetical protein
MNFDWESILIDDLGAVTPSLPTYVVCKGCEFGP